MKPRLLSSPWKSIFMLSQLCFILAVQAATMTLTPTSPAVIEPTPVTCDNVPSDFCMNGGKCVNPKPDDVIDAGSGDCNTQLICECRNGFTGSRCESNLTCTDLSCKSTEVCDYNWSTQQLECIPENTSGDPPICVKEEQKIEFKYHPGNVKKRILCLDMYEFNSSSLCSDADDSLTYVINKGPPELPDLFCLEVDYQYYKICLRVNATHRHNVILPQATVSIFAEENSALERKALLKLRIIFNKPPLTEKPIINWRVNAADLSPLDVIAASETTSDNKLTISVHEASSTDFIQPNIIDNKLHLKLKATWTSKVRRIRLPVLITDDGYPSLSTNITVRVVVAALRCPPLPPINVDIRDVKPSTSLPVGDLGCTTLSDHYINTEIISNTLQPGLSLSITDNTLILSRDASTSIYPKSERVVLTTSMVLYPAIASSHNYTINIEYFSLVWFKSDNITWIDDYQVKSSGPYKQLEAKILQEINAVINDTKIAVSIVQFRPNNWVDVLLRSSESLISSKVQTIIEQVKTGTVGRLLTDPSGGDSRDTNGHIFKPEASFITKFRTEDYYLESTVVLAKCEAEHINPTGEVVIEWTLDGHVIRPLPGSRFQVNATNPRPWTIKSTLTIVNVSLTDAGTLICHARDVTGRQATSEGLSLNVLFAPEIQISPLVPTQFVEENEELTLECRVVAPGADASVQWKKNGVNFSAASSIKVKITTDANYTCAGTNLAGEGEGETTRVILLSGETLCPSESDDRKTNWDKTKAGVTAVLICPQGYTGTVRRACKADGSWDEPNYSDCVQESIVNIKNQIKKLESGIAVADTESLVGNLSTITESSELGEQEIVTITNAISDLTQLTSKRSTARTAQQMETTKKFAKAAVNLIGKLIDPKQKLDNITSENTSVSVTLLSTMDKVSELLGESVTEGETEEIVTDNIVLTVGKTDPFNPTDVTYPTSNSSTPSTLSANLSSELFKFGSDLVPVTYSVIAYTNLTSLPLTVNENITQNDSSNNQNFEINSDILSVNIFSGELDFNTSQLKKDALFTFSHLNTSLDFSTCSFWNISESSWDNKGCTVVSTNQTSTTCACSHLTNFALLMKPIATIETKHSETLSTITLIGCTVSIVCLLLTIFIYAFVWRYVRSDRAILLLNLCVALIIALVLFLFGVDKTANKAVCSAIAVGLHYFYLVVFFLMLAEGIEVLVSIVKVFSSRSKLRELIIMGWGVPLVIVAIAAGVTELEGYGNDLFCWLSIRDGLIWAFVGPALAVILVNFVIVTKITCSLLQTRVMINKDVRDKAKAAVRSIAVLLPIMGLAWIFGILAVSEDLIVFDYIFTILNSLQGLCIFIFHCFINRKVREGLANRRRRYRSRNTDLSAPNSKSAQHRRGSSRKRIYGEESSDDRDVSIALQGRENPGFIASRYSMGRESEIPPKRPVERLSYPSNRRRNFSYLNSFPEESEGYSTLSVGEDPRPIYANTEASKADLTQEHFKPALMRGLSAFSGGGRSDRSGSLNSDELSVFSGLPRPRLHKRPFT